MEKQRSTGVRVQLECLVLLYFMLICRARVIPRGPAQQDCMMDWLLSLNISQNMTTTYRNIFETELVDQDSLRLMSLDNLQSLGILAFGHRMIIYNAATSGMHDICRNGGCCRYSVECQPYTCSCPAGFSGARCRNAASGCSGRPCKNGGTCTEDDSNSTIYCTCPPGYHGDLCQHLSSDDNSLAQAVVALSNELQALKEASQTTALAIADTMRQSTGLRFFKPWMELNLFGVIFVRHFVIGSRYFLGVIAQSTRQVHWGVVIYELVNCDSLVHVQTLSTNTATCFKVFSLEGHHYLMVGHHFDHSRINPVRVNSQLYRWDNATSKFSSSLAPYPRNNLRTEGVMDVDYVILPDNNSFLAFAQHDDMESFNVPITIYRHHSSRGKDFYHFKDLPTAGAFRVNFFTFNSTTYLFVAEERSADRGYVTNSSIYYWNSTHFVWFQDIKTEAANDLLPFAIGNNFFVVAVNSRQGDNYNTQSKVYILRDGKFVFYYALDTKGAKKAEFIEIGIETFLVFSNSQDDTNGSVSTDSVIYRVEGSKFVCFQEIPTHNAMYVHVFKMSNGCPVLAIANKSHKPRLYKWTSYTGEAGDSL